MLHMRLDDQKQQVVNRRLSEDIVLDMGEGDRIVGIEILDASKHVNLEIFCQWNTRLSVLRASSAAGHFHAA